MKITKSHLRHIIKEELSNVLSETGAGTYDPDTGARQAINISKNTESIESLKREISTIYGLLNNILTREGK